MREIISSEILISFCGLYCGSCSSYLKNHCPGCYDSEKKKKCKVGMCCIVNSYRSCVDCKKYDNVSDCKLLNGWLNRIISVFSGSNRLENIRLISKIGYEDFASKMSKNQKICLLK